MGGVAVQRRAGVGDQGGGEGGRQGVVEAEGETGRQAGGGMGRRRGGAGLALVGAPALPPGHDDASRPGASMMPLSR